MPENNEDLKRTIDKLARELEKNSKHLERDSKYKDRTAKDIKDLLKNLNPNELNKDIDTILKHIGTNKKGLDTRHTIETLKNEILKGLIASNPFTLIMHKLGAFEGKFNTSREDKSGLKELLNAVKNKNSTVSDSGRPNGSAASFKMQNAMVQANNIAIIVKSAKDINAPIFGGGTMNQGTTKGGTPQVGVKSNISNLVAQKSGDALSDKIIDATVKKNAAGTAIATAEAGASNGALAKMAADVAKLGTIAAPVAEAAATLLAINAVLWLIMVGVKGIMDKFGLGGGSPGGGDPGNQGKPSPNNPFRKQGISQPKDQKTEDLIQKYAKANGLDPDLVKAFIQNESGFRQNVQSPAGAIGIMQVMPNHFKKGENPYDPETNIRVGTKLLGNAMKNNNGDYLATAVDYNAGTQTRKDWQTGHDTAYGPGKKKHTNPNHKTTAHGIPLYNTGPNETYKYANNVGANYAARVADRNKSATPIVNRPGNKVVQPVKVSNEIGKNSAGSESLSQKIDAKKKMAKEDRKASAGQQIIASATPRGQISGESTNLIFGITERVHNLYANEGTVTV